MVEKIGKFDVAIIGGGPGGYVAAIRAGQLGLKAVLIEKDPKPGGTCLHRGCIPTKALLQTAHLMDFARESAHYGVKTGDVQLDLKGAMRYKERVVKKNSGGIEFLLKKNQVRVLHGTGRLDGPNQIRIRGADGKDQVVDATHIVLATGSVAARPSFLDFSHPRIITSDEALQIRELPKHITILGAGAVGVEFASIFRSFGCQVVLVEMLDRLLPLEDQECSAELLKALKKRNIDCLVSTRLEKAEPRDQDVELVLTPENDKPKKLRTNLLLCAVGRWPYSEGLGLEKAGIKVDKSGFMPADRDQRTTVPNIFAIGDFIDNTPLLAHAASAEGIVAVEIIAGMNPPRIQADRIPSATYCHPEVASVGLTEQQARDQGYDVKVSKFPYSALGKGGIIGAKYGFFKLVAEQQYGEILGVHIVGDHATDLISEGCAVLGLESTAADLAHIVHPHPTLSEGMQEAAHGLLGGAIHT
ncbi:MAG: dihydrolipoyl dehydrogenase [Planctomycetota bacterium]